MKARMTVREFNNLIIGRIIVYKFTADGHGFEVLWDGDMQKIPTAVLRRKIIGVAAAKENVFHVYVESEG